MLKSVLIGIDGTNYGQAAVSMAVRWARKTHLTLVGVEVVEESVISRPQAVPLGADYFKHHRDETLIADAKAAAKRGMAEFQAECARLGIPCLALEDEGDSTAQILRESQRHDLVVLGRRTAHPSHRPAHADSLLTTVLKGGCRPVVTVPEKLADRETIVVAYDGSMQAARALQSFALLGLSFAAPIHVATVCSDRAAGVRHAQRAIDFLAHHQIAGHSHIIESADPVGELLRTLSVLGAGMLVMGVFGQSPVREFFFGSVTESLLDQADVPMFLCH